jgi:cellulose synthase/poly-beta-1,6-N-acetylglucosamine synthase-like glycosyltransferase
VVTLLAGSLALVAYVFAGYPAIAALLSRLRPRPVHAQAGFTPTISLIVLAFNEADVIEAKLRNVAELDYPPDRLEVVVVTDGSDDGTPERADRMPGISVLHRPQRRGKLAAMNRGVQSSSGEVLVFSDANNLYSRNALRELVAPLGDPAVGLVTGRKAIADVDGSALDHAEGLYWRYESKIKEWESASGSVVGVAGEILAFRRAAYRSPQAGVMNEDFVQALLVASSGWRVLYAPRALSVERASATIQDEAVRRARLTTGRAQALRRLLPMLLRRHPRLAWQVISHKGLRPLVPWALLAAAASNVRLAPCRVWARALLGLQALFYFAATLGWHNERSGRRSRWTYLPFYFCRMNVATLAGLRDFAGGRHEAVWAKVRRG